MVLPRRLRNERNAITAMMGGSRQEKSAALKNSQEPGSSLAKKRKKRRNAEHTAQPWRRETTTAP